MPKESHKCGWNKDLCTRENIELDKLTTITTSVITSIITSSVSIFIKEYIEKRRKSRKESMEFYERVIKYSDSGQQLYPEALRNDTSRVKLGLSSGEKDKIEIIRNTLKYSLIQWPIKDVCLKKMFEEYENTLKKYPAKSDFDGDTFIYLRVNEQWQNIVKYCEKKAKKDKYTIEHV